MTMTIEFQYFYIACGSVIGHMIWTISPVHVAQKECNFLNSTRQVRSNGVHLSESIAYVYNLNPYQYGDSGFNFIVKSYCSSLINYQKNCSLSNSFISSSHELASRSRNVKDLRRYLAISSF